MTDFLTNLAARTIAQPSLLPRTRGRFEPAAADAAPLVWPEATPAVSSLERGDRSRRFSTDTKAVAAATALQTVAEEPQREAAPVQAGAPPEEALRRTLPPRPVPVVQQRESATPAPTPHIETPHQVERETVIEVVR